MSIIERSRMDINRFLNNNNEFAQDMTIETPDSTTTLEIRGWFVKHHAAYDTEGNLIDIKHGYITISEKDLTDASYPVRDLVTGEVNLMNHKITTADSTGTQTKYVISRNLPDEFLGIIGLVLKDFET